MRNFVLALAAVTFAGALFAQAPAAGGGGAAAAGGTSPVVTNPTYVAVNLEVTVNRPAAEVWARVGKYCDIAEWLRLACTVSAGKEGELGEVRSLAGGRILEILVGKTEFSYTYTQPVRAGQPYNLYHGTVEARPATPTTTKLLYSLVWDNSMLADDAARERDKMQKAQQFQGALDDMKILAEGGTMPPAPARGGGRGQGGGKGPGGAGPGGR